MGIENRDRGRGTDKDGRGSSDIVNLELNVNYCSIKNLMSCTLKEGKEAQSYIRRIREEDKRRGGEGKTTCLDR